MDPAGGFSARASIPRGVAGDRPHPEESRFKHIELIAGRGRQVLMVLVLMGGEILQRFITLDEPVTQEQLSRVADRFNNLYTGRKIEENIFRPHVAKPA